MADFLQVKKDLVHITGRYDLVADVGGADYSDPTYGLTAKYLLNAGQRLLDKLTDTPKTQAWYFCVPSAGDVRVDIQYCRAIHSVWVYDNDDNERARVNRCSLPWLLEQYPGDPDDNDQGAPEYYAINVLGLSPEQASETSADFDTAGIEDYHEVYFESHWAHTGIVWRPASDGNYTLRILGHFRSPTLSADTDLSWWTVYEPEALVAAAQYVLEGAYRNTQGMKDFAAYMEPFIKGVDDDLATEDMHAGHVMEG